MSTRREQRATGVDEQRCSASDNHFTQPSTVANTGGRVGEFRLKAQQLSLREQLERNHFLLERLSVASTRLLQSLEAGDVFDALAEIIATLIGSEEVAIFEYSPSARTFLVSKSWGVEQETLQNCVRGGGILEWTARSGSSQYRGRQQSEALFQRQQNLTACLLLKSGEELVGALAIFGLLPQKACLEWADFELLKFIEVYGSAAIQIDRLQSKVAP